MQGPAMRIAREEGFTVIAVDGNKNAPCARLADRFLHIDLKDKEGIETAARKIKDGEGLCGVMTSGTDFSATVAWVAEKLRLHGIPYQNALDASDKERMRRRFRQHGIPSPEFIAVGADTINPEKFEPPPLPFPFPVVVKPVDNMGSRGCRRVDSPADLENALTSALSFSRGSRVIIEQYMDGPEFSIDAIVQNGEITICGLADRHIFFPPFFIEMGHTMPTSSIDEKTKREIIDVFKAGIKCLGITLGAAKGDIKLTKNGPMIGEIAARLSGGYMSGWTYPYSSGVEPTKAALEACCGLPVRDLKPQKDWVSAERAFISIDGKIIAIKGRKYAENIEYINDIFFRVTEGDSVNFPENNVTKCGNVISAAPTHDLAVKAVETAVRSVLFRLEAPNTETERFLGQSCDFPPDAFGVSPAVRAGLAAMLQGNAIKGNFSVEAPICIENFDLFFKSGALDYAGRTAEESLDAVRNICGTPLPFACRDEEPAFGREFWGAMIRGGYQGAAYIVDKFLKR
ncbi:hypothetical protein FACS1894190_11410 [Spirochaetia bacterium]|nr:hypothetical protein FACS1894190_11410 [Spirochaetia bacterium]